MNSNYYAFPFRLIFQLLSVIFFSFSLAACSSPTANPASDTSPSHEAEAVNPMFSDPFTNQNDNEVESTATQTIPEPSPEPTSTDSGIVIDLANETIPFNPMLLGTNIPAWLGRERLTNRTFIERTKASGVSMIRIPGGSWANYYEWLPCEQENICPWEWGVLTPTDFINFIKATNLEAMYTVNINGTSKEAAALVAFFNGSIDDDTVIGVDVLGYDWGKVRDWAQLRSDHGNENPVDIKYWEVGNEIYAGKQNMGSDCNQGLGWEDVWTCDGMEYVNGIGEGDQRKEGFLEYIDAMKAVDPFIFIGAVGIFPQNDWNNWGNEVISEAGDVLDFYSIHEYGYFNPPSNEEAILAKPQIVWEPMIVDVRDAFDKNGNGRFPPIAITEYNLIAAQNKDDDQLMTRTVNMLFMADTIGQMATHGFTIANQWNLANGQADNGTDYGLIHADTFKRYPQYYVFPLWAKFGSELLPVASSFPGDTTLSVYAGKQEDNTISLLTINKTGESITSNIQILNAAESFSSGSIDVVQTDSLDSQTVTWNGIDNPSDDLTDIPSTRLGPVEAPFSHTFAPYSITLIQLSP